MTWHWRRCIVISNYHVKRMFREPSCSPRWAVWDSKSQEKKTATRVIHRVSLGVLKINQHQWIPNLKTYKHINSTKSEWKYLERAYSSSQFSLLYFFTPLKLTTYRHAYLTVSIATKSSKLRIISSCTNHRQCKPTRTRPTANQDNNVNKRQPKLQTPKRNAQQATNTPTKPHHSMQNADIYVKRNGKRCSYARKKASKIPKIVIQCDENPHD